MRLSGTVALLTGAKRIGAVVAEALALRGADIVLSYARSEPEAQDAAEAVRRAGARATVIKADLSSPDACTRLVDDAASAYGRLDVLVNMASVYTAHPFDQLTLREWDAVMNVDLRAAFLCARAAVPYMRRSGGGRIINFSDWVAASGRPRYQGFLPYFVAKAGVKALSEALALELADDNILVNTIAPGPIVAPPDTTVEERQRVEAATPLGRWGGEAEIVKAVLAFVESDFITGETLRVDGGRHLK